MEIEYKDWQNLDLRVAEVLDVEDHPDADKLYVLRVKIGDEEKTIVAGVKQHYSKEELIGKKIIVFTNLKPIVLRGVKSEGMLLAASEVDEVVLLTPDRDINSGAKIS
ncbi:methionine--tRNA ligase subunit beta [Candidatus Woesearchaeota archaeon]|jgi:methionine--tRNA ligase beta chain|nr:methionine--tRNA ligase subunit beta [Candidatus Woesearchaeota archaeon]MBT4321767.1 methionine--tRNA ligase subunit beta [Candidatus Woesearchaeota archaeon]MBT4630898.1 methionine--tRNA ligase subunit beta [Candidatus Woesearchaeota archaeon]